MPNTLYDVPVCQQSISPVAQLAEGVTVDHEVIGFDPNMVIFYPFALHMNNPQWARDC